MQFIFEYDGNGYGSDATLEQLKEKTNPVLRVVLPDDTTRYLRITSWDGDKPIFEQLNPQVARQTSYYNCNAATSV